MLTNNLNNLNMENNTITTSIVSSKMSLLRNFEGYSFVNNLKEEDRARLEDELLKALSALHDKNQLYHLEKLDKTEKLCFYDKGLINNSFMEQDKGRFSILPRNNISIVFNCIEHMRMTLVSKKLFDIDMFKQLENVENRIGTSLPYMASTRYGFLTSNIRNCGLGLKVSVLIHLKGLVAEKKIDEVTKLFSERGYSVTPWFYKQDDREKETEYYMVSSKLNFGLTENQLVERFLMGIGKLIEMNHESLKKYVESNSQKVEDDIYRSFGLLKFASSMGYEEALSHLSFLRIGLDIGLDIQCELDTLNQLFINIKDGYVQKVSEEKKIEFNQARASIIKELL